MHLNTSISHSVPCALKHKQHGAVLIVSLVILLIMTLIGASNMQSSGFQQKMANNSKARMESFQVAESTLRYAEDKFYSAFSVNFSTTKLLKECPTNSTECFDSSCAGGLCFSGTFNNVDPLRDCALSSSVVKAPYLDETLWEDGSNKFQTAPVVQGALSNNYESDPKYILEFLCYVPVNNTSECKPSSPDDSGCAPLFRATTLVERKGIRARVMLSSTFRIVKN